MPDVTVSDYSYFTEEADTYFVEVKPATEPGYWSVQIAEESQRDSSAPKILSERDIIRLHKALQAASHGFDTPLPPLPIRTASLLAAKTGDNIPIEKLSLQLQEYFATLVAHPGAMSSRVFLSFIYGDAPLDEESPRMHRRRASSDQSSQHPVCTEVTLSWEDEKGKHSTTLPVLHPYHQMGNRCINVRTLMEKTGFFTHDPGFTSTSSCESAITFIDGEKGELRHRGYAIKDIAEQSSFPEVAFLLIEGELPTPSELRAFDLALKSESMVHEKLITFFQGFKSDAHPMAIMVGVVGALSAFYPDSMNIFDHAQRRTSAIRLVAKMPTIAAISYKTAVGEPVVYPDHSLAFAENFLHMMFATPCAPYKVNPVHAKALETILVLHADHEQNASTSTVRIASSSQANPFACIAAGIASLWGPSHGGANEAVLCMLDEIGTPDRIPLFLDKAKDKSDPFRLMGFGHRVYKNHDPRATLMRGICEQVLASVDTSRTPELELARALEQQALQDEYFAKRKLYPNVDFYSGIVLRAIGIPRNMFTVVFAVARTVGWVAQWNESFLDREQRISRPRQLYVGMPAREFVPLDARDDSVGLA
ncbi:hypothetical protein AB1Y20_012085 [Prymnesium parvum]|uniref:Citrate synthase n=1 Tax=Prymnesium parvum TaxID=97485 RepID=A0AB34IQS7_PRYPA